MTSINTGSVYVQGSTIRTGLNKYGFYGKEWPRKKLFLSKKKTEHYFNSQKFYSNKPQTFWNSIVWTDETKVEMFGCHAECAMFGAN